MKKLVLTLAMLLMVVGATISVLKWLQLGPFELTEEEKKEVVEPTLDEELRLIDLEPLVINVFDGDKVAATIQIQVKLETHGTDNSVLLNRQKRRIQSAFLRELHAYIPRMLRDHERLDINILKTRLLMVSDRVVEKNLVSDVLIQSVNQRQGR